MGAKSCVLLNCGQQSQLSKVRHEFDAGRVNRDPPMTCADWPVAGNLTLLQHSNRIHTQTVTPVCLNGSLLDQLVHTIKGKGMVLYSAVSSPLDRSKAL